MLRRLNNLNCLFSIAFWGVCSFFHDASIFLIKLLPANIDSFHLCLFNFPFIYHFYFVITNLFKSPCWNPADLFIFKSFHQHFKKMWKGVLLKREMQFLLLSLLLYSEMLSQMITFIHLNCHLSYISSCK